MKKILTIFCNIIAYFLILSFFSGVKIEANYVVGTILFILWQIVTFILKRNGKFTTVQYEPWKLWVRISLGFSIIAMLFLKFQYGNSGATIGMFITLVMIGLCLV